MKGHDFHIKDEIRILALDDTRLPERGRVVVVGVVYRGAKYLDGMISFSVEKDGNDATEMFLETFGKSRHNNQINVIMMKGITVGGFNCFDIKEINSSTGRPVVVVMRKPPGEDFWRAAGKFPHVMKCSENAGEIKRIGELYCQKSGCSWEFVEGLLKKTVIRGNIPEPLRVAHIIASGLSGDSHGRA